MYVHVQVLYYMYINTCTSTVLHVHKYMYMYILAHVCMYVIYTDYSQFTFQSRDKQAKR